MNECVCKGEEDASKIDVIEVLRTVMRVFKHLPSHVLSDHAMFCQTDAQHVLLGAC